MTYDEIHAMDALSDQYGSPYAAANAAANAARDLVKLYDNKILDSEAISWCITGEAPKILATMQSNKSIPYERYVSYQIDELLNYVEDPDVVESVRISFRESTIARHLIYVYNSRMDEPRRTRVRVLTRMIWYEFHPYYKEE